MCRKTKRVRRADGPSIGHDFVKKTVCDNGHTAKCPAVCAICRRNTHGLYVGNVCIRWQTLYKNEMCSAQANLAGGQGLGSS